MPDHSRHHESSCAVFTHCDWCVYMFVLICIQYCRFEGGAVNITLRQMFSFLVVFIN